jgi:DNA-binding FadR family transcriptional regulator
VTGAQFRTAVAVVDRISLELAAGAGAAGDPGSHRSEYEALRFFQESLSWSSSFLDTVGSPANSSVRRPSDADAPPERKKREVRYDGVHRTRAGQIFHDLVTAVEPGRWIDGLMLGSECDLCERFAADRAVLRQAIRILETSELAESLPGRGHGLVARRPGQASLSRMICCHFAATRLGAEDIFPVFRSFSIELARLAAVEAAPADVLALKRLLSRMRRQQRLRPVGPQDLMAIDERQFGLVRNPLLQLFARSLKAYSSWLVPASLPEAGKAIAAFVESSRAVADAIAEGDQDAAAAAQRAKFDRMTAACSAPVTAAAAL